MIIKIVLRQLKGVRLIYAVFMDMDNSNHEQSMPVH